MRPAWSLVVSSAMALWCSLARGQGTGMPDVQRLARLAAIASELQQPAADAAALFTEAVRLLGFAVWSEEGQPIAPPVGLPRLGLAVTDAEIREFAAMFQAGHTVMRDDLLAAVDVLHGWLGIEGSIVPPAIAWLRDGASSANPSVRALGVFLADLGVLRAGGATNALDLDADCELEPLQALLILRVLTEDIGTPLRRVLMAAPAESDDSARPRRGPSLDGDSVDVPTGGEAIGWAEEGYAGGITGLFAQVSGSLGRLGRGISDGVGKANAVAMITKFVAIYGFVGGEAFVDAPGQPLVRSKDDRRGEARTLVARFGIDVARVATWRKDHRRVAMLLELDPAAPQASALVDLETEWTFAADSFSDGAHLLRLAQDQPDISKIRTDANGEARLRIEGAPQARQLDAAAVLPLEKRVRIVVAPQVRSAEVQRALVDAVTGAIGIKGGGVGFVTPVVESLYRMKWRSARRFDLAVRDWVEAEAIGSVEVTIRASGSRFDRGSSYRMVVDRQLAATDLRMLESGAEMPPPLDPDLAKMVTKQVVEQVEAGRRQMTRLAMKRTFLGEGLGKLAFELHDADRTRGQAAAAAMVEVASAVWDGSLTRVLAGGGAAASPLRFVVHCDLEQKVARLELDASTEARVVQRRSVGSGEPTVADGVVAIGLFAGLQLDPPWSGQGIVMPLVEAPTVEPGVVRYSGEVVLPFRFGRVGGAPFRGKAIVAWSIVRRVKR